MMSSPRVIVLWGEGVRSQYGKALGCGIWVAVVLVVAVEPRLT